MCPMVKKKCQTKKYSLNISCFSIQTFTFSLHKNQRPTSYCLHYFLVNTPVTVIGMRAEKQLEKIDFEKSINNIFYFRGR